MLRGTGKVAVGARMTVDVCAGASCSERPAQRSACCRKGLGLPGVHAAHMLMSAPARRRYHRPDLGALAAAGWHSKRGHAQRVAGLWCGPQPARVQHERQPHWCSACVMRAADTAAWALGASRQL